MENGDLHTGQEISNQTKTNQETDEQAIKAPDKQQQFNTEVKNAHASGLGALERGEESQIEKMNTGNLKKDDTVY
jgi:hypothetical protein